MSRYENSQTDSDASSQNFLNREAAEKSPSLTQSSDSFGSALWSLQPLESQVADSESSTQSEESFRNAQEDQDSSQESKTNAPTQESTNYSTTQESQYYTTTQESSQSGFNAQAGAETNDSDESESDSQSYPNRHLVFDRSFFDDESSK